MLTAIVAFGGNLVVDNVPIRDRIEDALQQFSASMMNITAVSRWYQTPAYPVESGGEFLNGVVLVETELEPVQILAALGEIELRVGRVRKARWEARIVDLDLIAAQEKIMPNPAEQTRWRTLPPDEQARLTPDELILPHPRLQDRSFVLYPMRDVAPDWRHPVTGESVGEMIADLPAERHAEISVVE